MAEFTSQFPGVFRGQTRLASQQDLLILKEYIEKLIAGPINELGENGYIPWKYKPDGTLDIEYLFPELLNKFAEQTGITINKNGVKFAENITGLNFKGKYVTLDIDENGCLVCDIDEPSMKVPHFNESNRFGDASVKIDSAVVEDMIIPSSDIDTISLAYGDWTAGTRVKGINANRTPENQYSQFDLMDLSTYGPVYASSTSSYFEVIVTNGANSKYASFISDRIKSQNGGNSLGSSTLSSQLQASSAQESPHIYIYISDLKELDNRQGYSFKPKFSLNLKQIIPNGGRFKIIIRHYDGTTVHEWMSDDMLYNYGVLPVMGQTGIQIVSGEDAAESGRLVTNHCSGLKYLGAGIVKVKINNVHNLNNMAAVDNPIEYHFDFATTDENTLVSNYDLDYSKIANFTINLKINENHINYKKVSGEVTFCNAFGKTIPQYIKVPILINSQHNLKNSTALNEYFSDESFRVLSNFELNTEALGSYSTVESWDSTADLTTYDEGKGLMVIPGVGLMYPFGDWSVFVPAGPDYTNGGMTMVGEKYYARVFGQDQVNCIHPSLATNDETHDRVRFGGIFKFEGITKEDFNDSRFSAIISCNQGQSWYDLKTIRNMKSVVRKRDGNGSLLMNTIGVLTKIEEGDDCIYVHWSYPSGIASEQAIYFRLGLQPSDICIKSISLLNTEKEEEW